MSKIKLFEEFHPEEGTSSGYVSVPSDFEDRLKGLGSLIKQRSEFYSVPLNQIKVDLFYGIKYEIRIFLENSEKHTNDKTQDKYEMFLNSEIFDDESQSGILEKYSGGKYDNIERENVPEVKEILWNYINTQIPFNEVDYYYTYDLQGKLLNLLSEFLDEIVEKELFDPEKGISHK